MLSKCMVSKLFTSLKIIAKYLNNKTKNGFLSQLLLIDKKISDASPLLTQAGYLVDNWQGSQYQKEYLKVFSLFLQVCLPNDLYFILIL